MFDASKLYQVETMLATPSWHGFGGHGRSKTHGILSMILHLYFKCLGTLVA